jgi:flagellar hook assembly protein FlgD
VSEHAVVTVNVLNSSGSVVRCLLSNVSANGSVSAKWDRKDASGHRVKSGTYTVKVSATDDFGDAVTASTTAKVS